MAGIRRIDGRFRDSRFLKSAGFIAICLLLSEAFVSDPPPNETAAQRTKRLESDRKRIAQALSILTGAPAKDLLVRPLVADIRAMDRRNEAAFNEELYQKSLTSKIREALSWHHGQPEQSFRRNEDENPQVKTARRLYRRYGADYDQDSLDEELFLAVAAILRAVASSAGRKRPAADLRRAQIKGQKQ
jgi:hypothetical protein